MRIEPGLEVAVRTVDAVAEVESVGAPALRALDRGPLGRCNDDGVTGVVEVNLRDCAVNGRERVMTLGPVGWRCRAGWTVPVPRPGL